MVLVYNKIGGARLPFQITRLIVILFFILLIFSARHNWGLFLLTAYHMFSGLFILFFKDAEGFFEQLFGAYHIILGFVIYFHDWIEDRLIKKK